jgi:hypothetical protein
MNKSTNHSNIRFLEWGGKEKKAIIPSLENAVEGFEVRIGTS